MEPPRDSEWRVWWEVEVPAEPQPEDLERVRKSFEALGRPPSRVEVRDAHLYVEVMTWHFSGYQALGREYIVFDDAMKRSGFPVYRVLRRAAVPSDGDWEPWRKYDAERNEQQGRLQEAKPEGTE
jgi:hypothetical protein